MVAAVAVVVKVTVGTVVVLGAAVVGDMPGAGGAAVLQDHWSAAALQCAQELQRLVLLLAL